MTNSKLTYEINIFAKTIECKDYSDRLNYHNFYNVSTDSGVYAYEIVVSEKAKPFFDKAEFYFERKEMDSALYFYKLTIEQDSALYYVMTYIGQLYGAKGDFATAEKWYKKVIEKNYIDYMAHWLLADIYLATNKINEAVDEITIARILNRNNPRIKKYMVDIFTKADRDTLDWCFSPQVEFKKIAENKISVGITSDGVNQNWIGYAMAKALWAYEPGYSESMGVPHGDYSTIEDKECLIALLTALKNAKIKIKNEPQLSILKEAFENKQIDEYIMYEIVLPQNPIVAYQLTVQSILKIKDYILNFRNPEL